jgi:hypothetical protein
VCVQLSDAVVVALITAVGVVVSALMGGIAMVAAAWLQSRGHGES